MMKRTLQHTPYRFFLLAISLFLIAHGSNAQAQRNITGTVNDEQGAGLSGVTITESSGKRYYTEADGSFTISFPATSPLTFSREGYLEQNVSFSDSTTTLTIMLASGPQKHRVDVAYGQQEYDGVTAAISSVGGDVMRKTPVPALSNTLYGRLPGLTVLQGSGEPGYDVPFISVRGLGTYQNAGFLVFVDGFEASFDQMAVEEIERVSVLKDAAALALYGIRGANGALLVTTKRGEQGKTKINFNARTGWQKPTRLPEFVNAYDYARLYNEALTNDGMPARYTAQDLEAYRSGSDPYLHPDVNWYDEVLRKSAPMREYSITFSGGNKGMKYFLLLGHLHNQGLYANTDKDREENSNADFKRYNFRSNIDIQLSNIVSASIDLGGRIEDRSYPNYNGVALWENMARYPANVYPVRNPNGSWGGNAIYPNNPVASVLGRGFASTHDRNLMATLRLTEKLDFITKGLSIGQALSFNNWHRGNYNKTRDFAAYELSKGMAQDGSDSIIYTMHGTETDFAIDESANDQWNRTNVQVSINYDRQFGEHALNAMLLYHQDVLQVSGNNVPYANQSVMGRIHYGLRSKYFAELSFSYSGSERFKKGNRFGFFPALSGAWIISRESFLQNNTVVSFLKARGSVGLTGNDRLAGSRFAYAQDYYYSGNYSLGNNNTPWGTIMEGPLGNEDISWEKSMKYNIGVEGTLFSKLNFTADFFYERRTDILATSDATVPAYVGVATAFENLGTVRNHGVELALQYNGKAGDLEYFVGGNTFFARNKILEMNEVTRAEDYLYRTGHSIIQPFGLEAIGFFEESDFDPSGELKGGIPVQKFTPVKPGDIRYKDQNDDMIVDDNDEIAIGHTNIPEITYAITLGARYKGFDFELFFQGIANRDVYLNGSYFWALVNDNNIPVSALGRWTPDNAASATYPRLTTLPNDNNYRRSTFWMKSGSVLRLRNVELGYTLPARAIRRSGLSQVRLYVNAVNPFTWDKVDAMDAENLSGYPVMKSYNIGIRVQL
jgi:TonB-linked SusC/RagA family outer membrane protein